MVDDKEMQEVSVEEKVNTLFDNDGKIIVSDLDIYQVAARSTLATKETVGLNLAHCFNGLDSEMGEIKDALKRGIFYQPDVQTITLEKVDMVNVKEEIGDSFWFIAVIIDLIENDMPNNEIPTFKHLVHNARATADQLTMTDDNEFYGYVTILSKLSAELDYEHYSNSRIEGDKLVEMMTGLISMITYAGWTLEEVLSSNLNKLIGKKGRYKDLMWDALRAREENRDRDTERDLLEA